VLGTNVVPLAGLEPAVTVALVTAAASLVMAVANASCPGAATVASRRTKANSDAGGPRPSGRSKRRSLLDRYRGPLLWSDWLLQGARRAAAAASDAAIEASVWNTAGDERTGGRSGCTACSMRQDPRLRRIRCGRGKCRNCGNAYEIDADVAAELVANHLARAAGGGGVDEVRLRAALPAKWPMPSAESAVLPRPFGQ
jgi:hypothetical protein